MKKTTIIFLLIGMVLVGGCNKEVIDNKECKINSTSIWIFGRGEGKSYVYLNGVYLGDKSHSEVIAKPRDNITIRYGNSSTYSQGIVPCEAYTNSARLDLMNNQYILKERCDILKMEKKNIFTYSIPMYVTDLRCGERLLEMIFSADEIHIVESGKTYIIKEELYLTQEELSSHIK